MASRAVLSYDDITSTSGMASGSAPTANSNVPDGPPAKKPRWMKTAKANGPAPKHTRIFQQPPHWDSSIEEDYAEVSYDAVEPSISAPSVSAPRGSAASQGPSQKVHQKSTTQAKGFSKGGTKKQSQSITLSDPNMWDDRSLVDAWDAANEEYERMHGPGKSWKDEPLYKSSVWYAPKSAAPSAETTEDQDEYAAEEVEDAEMDDELGFDETWDGDMAQPTTTTTGPQLPDLTALGFDATQYSTQEIFQQALNSAWWLGYWSAMHQVKTSEDVAEDGKDE
ncbi:hypothetical protein DL93DRAFT_2078669 [Clavulina sp. PMI_390]|nr:hypothetical protein DL93DRAFT_2078669 [Clavulina sp. PMI_390]